MKNILKISILTMALAAASFGLSPKALAAAPYLSLSNAGGDNVTVSISNADPYSAVQLYYTLSGSTLPTQIGNFGTTSGNGYFSSVISGSAYGLTGNSQIYVMVNGQQSNIVSWNGGNSGCSYYGCGNIGGLTFSQTNVNLNVGQSTYVSISSGVYMYSYSPYVSSNTNSNVASASVSNNQLYITGNNTGSTTITVCLSGGSTCGSVYVTVGGGGYNNGSISLSQNNISLSVGQSQNVTISNSYYNNYNNSYYISSNSNSNVVSASISGSSLYVYAQNSGSGTISVCQTGSSQCASLYVTVTGSGSSISLSQTSLSMNAGQSSSVSIYGNGGYYISSNTNSNVAGAVISGSVLNITAYAQGSANITVCQNTGSCATLYVTVSGGYGTVSLSQTNVTISQGQSIPVTISGGYSSSYYISSNTNSSAVSATISGGTLNLYGNSSGYSTVTVCQNSATVCASVYVTVNGYNSGNISLYTTNITQPVVGQYYSYQLQASGGTSPYYFTLQSGQLPAGLSLSSSGLIFGTPQNNASASFAVRVYDNYNHSNNYNFTLASSGNNVLGASVYNNGTLINEGGTVYIVYKNSKTGFASASAFLGLGYNFNRVINVGTTNIPFSGYTVSTSNASHPWGSWIKSGSTVYFVHEMGLIPVPDWNTFLNNSGNGDLVVQANSYDFSRAMLSVMAVNDPRLR